MTLSIRCAVVVVLCVLLVPLDVAAQRDSVPADKPLSPFFFVEGADPAIDRLPLKDTRVDVAISGVIADVTVRQVYENRGTRPIHARYIFPASVELKYTELLVPTDGVYEFVYPTVVGPRYSEKHESQVSPGDEFVRAVCVRSVRL